MINTMTSRRGYKAKLWEIRQQTRGYLYKVRVESKVKAYRWVHDEVANWLCGMPPTPFVEVWVDERDGSGWRLYERVNLEELAQLERLESQDVIVRRG